MTVDFAKEYLLDDCDDCPENKDGECMTESHCFEVKRMAIQALEQTRWIPVSEKLPDCDVECLVVDKDGEYGIGFYREDAKAWDSPNWGWLERKDRVDNKENFTQPCGIGKVIVWMPLPQPYKAESEE